MIVNLNYILEYGDRHNCAVPAINCPSLDVLRAVINGAEQLNSPIIISHAQVHDEIIPIEEIGEIMVFYAKRAKVPVAVHLDHATDIDFIKKAIDIGFTSIMIDASSKPFQENIETTKWVVDYAHSKGISVEGELGTISTSGVELKESDTAENYTDPVLAKEFVERTGVDALAVSFGTVHGVYFTEPKLDFERLNQIHNSIGIPIVMHGGSGLKKEEYIKSIENGVRKINYFSYLGIHGGQAIERLAKKDDESVKMVTDYETVARLEMEKETREIIGIFSNKGDNDDIR